MPEKIVRNNNDGDHKNKKSNFKLNEDVKKLVKLTEKKFKKKSEEFYDSKKEFREAYYSKIIDLLPETISTLVKFGHKPELKEVKEEIYEKLVDEKFIKYLTKEIKKNDLEFTNMTLLPIILAEIVTDIQKANNELTKGEEKYEVNDLVELSRIILKKKLKKMAKAGIPEDLAFDVLTIIPDVEVLKKSAPYHFRKLFTVLYEHAKTKAIDFDKMIGVLFKDNENYKMSLIIFALLERKEKIANFNPSQNQLFNQITTWCFNTMEDLKKSDIENILKIYIKTRRRDESQNKDTNRRYYISSLLESDFPKITKIVEKIINENPDNKKYL